MYELEPARKRQRKEEDVVQSGDGDHLAEQFGQALLEKDWTRSAFYERVMKIYVMVQFPDRWISAINDWTKMGATVTWIERGQIGFACNICGAASTHRVKLSTNDMVVACVRCADRMTTLLNCFRQVSIESMEVKKRTSAFLIRMLGALEGTMNE